MLSSRPWHIAKFAVPALFFWFLFWHIHLQEKSRFASLFREVRDEKTIFVDDFLANEVDGQFTGSAIKELCNNKTWARDTILSCQAVPGGIGDVKNGILTCIRTAIEIGSAIILPGIVRRSTIDLAITVPHDLGPRRGVSLEYFFDMAYLNESLSAYCPQMRVYDSIDLFFDKPSMLDMVKFDLDGLPNMSKKKEIDPPFPMIEPPKKFGESAWKLFDEKSPPEKRQYPFHVHMNPSLFGFPAMEADPSELYRTFGRLLRVRTDLRRLAASALFNLHKAFHLPLDLTKGIRSDTFAAVELRTESDAREDKFPDYTQQASNALNYVVNGDMPIVFLGTGMTEEHTKKFVDKASEFNITVVTKGDLVEGTDASLLSTLSWDQLGLVDYELMLHAGLFAGSTQSSFAWNMALRRRYAYGEPPALDPALLLGSIRWHDQYSTIFGAKINGTAYELGIWP